MSPKILLEPASKAIADKDEDFNRSIPIDVLRREHEALYENFNSEFAQSLPKVKVKDIAITRANGARLD